MRIDDELRAKILDEQIFDGDLATQLENLRSLVTIEYMIEAWEDGLIK